jgi:peroxiredoxin
VSVDHIYSHNVFEASLGTLPYPLLSDWFKETARAYGVLNEEDLTAKRSVFIINKNGDIVYKNTAFKADVHEDYEACIRKLEELI